MFSLAFFDNFSKKILMDPVPLDFGIPGNSSAIQATHHNITMRSQKPERALQVSRRQNINGNTFPPIVCCAICRTHSGWNITSWTR
jgi:hypothetical protein